MAQGVIGSVCVRFMVRPEENRKVEEVFETDTCLLFLLRLRGTKFS
jgi:hypothetical protein